MCWSRWVDGLFHGLNSWTTYKTSDWHWNDVLFDGTAFVAGGSFRQLMHFTDPSNSSTFTYGTIGSGIVSSNNIVRILYSGSKYVAIGPQDYAVTSDDGKTWTKESKTSIGSESSGTYETGCL